MLFPEKNRLRAVVCVCALVSLLYGCTDEFNSADLEVQAGDQNQGQFGVIDPRLDEVLKSAPPNELIPVIVTLGEKADLTQVSSKDAAKFLEEHALYSQDSIKTYLRGKDVFDVQSIWIINALSLKASADVIRDISGEPGVEVIKLDSVLRAPEPLLAPSAPDGWNIDSVNASALWAMGYSGGGVVVATMDTGVDADHPLLSSKWRGGTNSWYDPNGEHSEPFDASGHGTAVMGIIVGGEADGAPVGVAPDAKWISVKIFGDDGFASYSDIHLGFQWLMDPDSDPSTDDQPHIVNNSWGLREFVGGCVTEFLPDILALRAAGILVTFSAGNEGPLDATSVSPANYSDSCAVGAADIENTIADFSSRGPSACDGQRYPQITAPGVSVKTADLTYGGAFPNSYTYVSGTSFASAHAAGVMALLLSAVPSATAPQIESSIKYGSRPVGRGLADNIYGYGLLDALGAYEMLVRPPDCSDLDGDRYFTDSVCRTEIDCDDSNPLVNPGASETKHDGIDEDCNGYDLTIDIQIAKYSLINRQLRVEATSALEGSALLELSGYGPMSWNAEMSQWELTVAKPAEIPRRSIVVGMEGRQSSITRIWRR